MAFREPLDEEILKQAEAIKRANVLGMTIKRTNKKHCRAKARGLRRGQRVWTRPVAIRVAEEKIGP